MYADRISVRTLPQTACHEPLEERSSFSSEAGLCILVLLMGHQSLPGYFHTVIGINDHFQCIESHILTRFLSIPVIAASYGQSTGHGSNFSAQIRKISMVYEAREWARSE